MAVMKAGPLGSSTTTACPAATPTSRRRSGQLLGVSSQFAGRDVEVRGADKDISVGERVLGEQGGQSLPRCH